MFLQVTNKPCRPLIFHLQQRLSAQISVRKKSSLYPQAENPNKKPRRLSAVFAF
jgi:hypothetical protein